MLYSGGRFRTSDLERHPQLILETAQEEAGGNQDLLSFNKKFDQVVRTSKGLLLIKENQIAH